MPEGKEAKQFVRSLIRPDNRVMVISNQLDKCERPIGRPSLGDGSDLGQLFGKSGHWGKIG